MKRVTVAGIKGILCALLLYGGLHFLFYMYSAKALSMCALVPVAAAGWLFGMWGGLVAGLVSIPLNIAMITLYGFEWHAKLYSASFLVGTAGLILVGTVVGRMRDLGSALREHRDRLHDLVRERTTELRAANGALKAREQELRAVNMQLKAHEEQLGAANEQLRDANDYLENIFKTKADGLIVSDHGIIVKVNRALETMLGYSEQELVGRKTLELAVPNDASMQLARPMIEELYEKGFIKNRQLEWCKKDGTPCAVEVNITLFKSSVGEPRGAVCEVRDISEHRKADEERLRLTAAVEQASETMMIFDRDGSIQYCNPALERLSGYKRRELIGKPYTFTSDSPDQQKLYQKVMRLVQSGSIWTGNISATVSDGTQREFEITISPVRDHSGTITSFVSIGRDVTREMHMEKLLRQSQKMEAIGTLAGGIAHDFNNILTAIIGYAELCLHEARDQRSLATKLSHILSSGSRARDLVKQILAFSRQTELEARPVQLRTIVKEALKLMRASLPVTIEISQNIRSDAIVVADPTQLHQIVMNLCTNADYAMAQTGGTLNVALQDVEVEKKLAAVHGAAPGPYVRLEVSDNGIGMTREVQDRIFEPFYTTKGKGEGTGMGLAVVHGIVRACGGFITVKSKPRGGSTFRVYLPAVDGEVPDEHVQPSLMPGGTEYILFVDDELTIVEMAGQMLSTLGYRVSTFNASPKALERFRESPEFFDVVITDQTMPKLTGLELAEHIRNINADIPIILCSGYHLDLPEEDLRRCGISTTLMKPLDFKTVAETIRQVLEASKTA